MKYVLLLIYYTSSSSAVLQKLVFNLISLSLDYWGCDTCFWRKI